MKIEVVQKRNKSLALILVVIIALFMMCMSYTKFNLEKGVTATPEAILWMFSNFLPDADSLSKIPDIFKKLLETIFLAVASTTFAGVCALFFSLIGGKVARLIASIARNIPDSVWAMIFLLSFGQNVLTGYLALFFASFGVLTRAFIETIDETSESTVEALKSTGASYLPIVFQGIIPSAIPQMLSWVLYMIETNIRSSTLIGILTGTGIGFAFDLYYKSMNYASASLVVIFIVIAVILIEYLSNKIRRVIL